LKNNFLPPGLRDIDDYLGSELENLEYKLISLMQERGIKRIFLPLIEYYDVFSKGIGEDKKRKTYKLIDPLSGRTIAIRSDVTPQIVRYWSNKSDNSLKAYYFEKILRFEKELQGKEKEILQAGVEFINIENINDVIVETLFQFINMLNLESVVVIFNTANMVDKLLDSVPDGLILEHKNFSKLKDSGVSSELLSVLLNPDNIYNLSDSDKIKYFGNNIDFLKDIAKKYKSRKIKIVIDPFFTKPSDYYSGLFFKVIYKGREIISGGRYDKLLDVYGKKGSAAGLAIDLFNVINN